MFVFLIFILLTSSIQIEASLFQSLKSDIKCFYHDWTDTKQHFFNHTHKDSHQNRDINHITETWRKTLINGSVNNKIPFNQMSLRDPETILRLAEYQTLILCPNLTSIKNTSKNNLRVGSFRIESYGNDTNHRVFWYLASNDDQKQLTLVHRGTTIHNRNDILDDLDPIRSGARHKKHFIMIFLFLNTNQLHLFHKVFIFVLNINNDQLNMLFKQHFINIQIIHLLLLVIH